MNGRDLGLVVLGSVAMGVAISVGTAQPYGPPLVPEPVLVVVAEESASQAAAALTSVLCDDDDTACVAANAGTFAEGPRTCVDGKRYAWTALPLDAAQQAAVDDVAQVVRGINPAIPLESLAGAAPCEVEQ